MRAFALAHDANPGKVNRVLELFLADPKAT